MGSHTTSAQNFYKILGVGYSASADDIRKAYKKRALETHPDKLDPNATEEDKLAADEQFHLAREAFETLGDEDKRKAYDLNLKIEKDPTLISDRAKQLSQHRKQWAKRLEEESDRRLAEYRETLVQQAKIREELTAKKPKTSEDELVSEMVNNMFARYPGLAAKREHALKRKAEKEQERKLREEQTRVVRV